MRGSVLQPNVRRRLMWPFQWTLADRYTYHGVESDSVHMSRCSR